MVDRLTRRLPYAAILAAMLFWGSSGIATKIALQSLPPLTLVTLRFLFAVSLMLLAGGLSGTLQRLRRQDVGLFVLAGFIQPFCYYLLETYGLKLLSSPTVAEVILSTGPLFAPLFAFLLLCERVTWYNIAGILVSTGGVLLMVLAGGTQFALGSPWGFLLLFLAVFAAVFYTILLRKIPDRYNSLTIVFYVQLCSLIFFLPVFCAVDLPHIGEVVFTGKAVGAVAYLAAFSSVAAFVLFCYTVRCIGVTRANAFNNIRPVFTALMMLCFFREHLPLLKWLGILLVIVGLFVCQRETRKS